MLRWDYFNLAGDDGVVNLFLFGLLDCVLLVFGLSLLDLVCLLLWCLRVCLCLGFGVWLFCFAGFLTAYELRCCFASCFLFEFVR